MSFSSEVKEELCRHINSARHCRLAEMAAMTLPSGGLRTDGNGEPELHIHTENSIIARKYFTLWKKTFNIEAVTVEKAPGKGGCTVSIRGKEAVEHTLETLKLDASAFQERRVNSLLIKNACCRRAFLRGAFLSVGSVSNPVNSYHLEFVCVSQAQARQLQGILQTFQVEAKIVKRKKYFVVYLKEGSSIVEVLNIMEAHVALMNLENTRILKEMRNSVNRRVNCEAANITKTVQASARQMEDIRFLEAHFGLENLPESLQETARMRLRYPDAPLKELGEYMTPPVGKSGINHRLRKLSELAESIRNKGGELL